MQNGEVLCERIQSSVTLKISHFMLYILPPTPKDNNFSFLSSKLTFALKTCPWVSVAHFLKSWKNPLFSRKLLEKMFTKHSYANNFRWQCAVIEKRGTVKVTWIFVKWDVILRLDQVLELGNIASSLGHKGQSIVHWNDPLHSQPFKLF